MSSANSSSDYINLWECGGGGDRGKATSNHNIGPRTTDGHDDDGSGGRLTLGHLNQVTCDTATSSARVAAASSSPTDVMTSSCSPRGASEGGKKHKFEFLLRELKVAKVQKARGENSLRSVEAKLKSAKFQIEELNGKFAHFRNPPPEYLKEYQSLTTQLNDLQSRENDLLDILDALSLRIHKVQRKLRKIRAAGAPKGSLQDSGAGDTGGPKGRGKSGAGGPASLASLSSVNDSSTASCGGSPSDSESLLVFSTPSTPPPVVPDPLNGEAAGSHDVTTGESCCQVFNRATDDGVVTRGGELEGQEEGPEMNLEEILSQNNLLILSDDDEDDDDDGGDGGGSGDGRSGDDEEDDGSDEGQGGQDVVAMSSEADLMPPQLSQLSSNRKKNQRTKGQEERRKLNLATTTTATTTTTQAAHLEFIRAFLPNCQRTTVPARRGVSLKDALFKAMKRRKLRAEFCLIFRKEPQKLRIDWNSDSALFSNEEVIVESIEPRTIQTSISHNFIRKTFFSLAFCEVCSKILFHGFRCDVCAFKFHPKCSKDVPSLCQPLRIMTHHHHGHHGPGTDNNRMTSSADHHHHPSHHSHHQSSSSSNRRIEPDENSGQSNHSGENDNYYSHLLAVSSQAWHSTAIGTGCGGGGSGGANRSGYLSPPSSTFSNASSSGVSKSGGGGQWGGGSDGGTSGGEARERSTSAPNVHHLIGSAPVAAAATTPIVPVVPPSAHRNHSSYGSSCLIPPASASSVSSNRTFFNFGTTKSCLLSNSQQVAPKTSPSKSGQKLSSSSSAHRPRARSADESSFHRVTLESQKQPAAPSCFPASAAAPSAPSSATHPSLVSSGDDLGKIRPTIRAKTKLTQRESAGIEDWEIPEEDIIWGERIGSGSFGTVYKGAWHGPVALKKLHMSEGCKPTPQQLTAFKNEVAVLRKTRHVNVLLFMGCIHNSLTIGTF